MQVSWKNMSWQDAQECARAGMQDIEKGTVGADLAKMASLGGFGATPKNAKRDAERRILKYRPQVPEPYIFDVFCVDPKSDKT